MEISQLPVAATIDPVNDTFPIVTNNLNATQQISRNTFLGLASQPVGISDTQTLTNKTITSPIISSPTFSGTTAGTFTLGGTITFPSSVVTLSGTQTLTNKTLTSPTINSPTISNATISADTITGYTTSNSGTIYGIGVTTGQISSNLTATGTLTVSGLVTASNGLTVSSGSVTLPVNTLFSTYLALSHALDGTNGVKSQSNAGTAGGTMYYINLGGIKMLWGTTSAVATGTSPSQYSITFPTSFFSTIQSFNISVVSVTGYGNQYANGNSGTSSGYNFYVTSPSGTGTATCNFFVIGT